MKKNTNLQGFTLIEILIVIGLIAILAAVTIIALNPADSIDKAKDSERNTEIAQIHSVINRFIVNGGVVPFANLTNCSVSSDGVAIDPATNWGNDSESISFNSTDYLAANLMPTDPDGGAYLICDTGNAMPLKITSPNESSISITR